MTDCDEDVDDCSMCMCGLPIGLPWHLDDGPTIIPRWVVDCTHDPVCDGPTECADHTDPDRCRICGDPTIRPDRLCDMHHHAAENSRRPA